VDSKLFHFLNCHRSFQPDLIPPTVEIRFQSPKPLGRKKARVLSKMYSSVGMSVLFCLSCYSSPVCLFCSAYPVLPIPLCLSYSACPVQPVLFYPSYSACLSCSACPVLPVLFSLSCFAYPILSVCPVLPVMFLPVMS
jgi:hypothetical protein